MYKQLLDGHEASKTTLSLTDYQRERLVGLRSILYLNLQNCSTVTMVKTSIHNLTNSLLPMRGGGGGGLFGPHHQTGSQNSRTLSPRVSKISDFLFMPFGHIVAKFK